MTEEARKQLRHRTCALECAESIEKLLAQFKSDTILQVHLRLSRADGTNEEIRAPRNSPLFGVFDSHVRAALEEFVRVNLEIAGED